MNWSINQLVAYENRRKSSRAKSERPVRDDAVAETPGEKKDPTRVVVRVTSYRRRLLDPDNLIGGTKYFIDSLKYAGLIPDDTEQILSLEVRQIKVSTKDQERTVIEL